MFNRIQKRRQNALSFPHFFVDSRKKLLALLHYISVLLLIWFVLVKLIGAAIIASTPLYPSFMFLLKVVLICTADAAFAEVHLRV